MMEFVRCLRLVLCCYLILLKCSLLECQLDETTTGTSSREGHDHHHHHHDNQPESSSEQVAVDQSTGIDPPAATVSEKRDDHKLLVEEPRDSQQVKADGAGDAKQEGDGSEPDKEAEQQQLTTDTSTTGAPTSVADEASLDEGKSTGETGKSTSTSTSTRAPSKSAGKNKTLVEAEWAIDSYCLNGGTVIFHENGQVGCRCTEEFYGARCQTRNICKTLVVDHLTGDQVCESIQRQCLRGDKFFRCECHADEYFVFKADHSPPPAAATPTPATPTTPEASTTNGRSTAKRPSQSTIAYDSILPFNERILYKDNDDDDDDDDDSYTRDRHSAGKAGRLSAGRGGESQQQPLDQKGYLAECRKIDKCLGVRCRQMSEACVDGQCQCNRDLGYIRDPADGLCKLLDPCRMPASRPGEAPVCGQARCVATYNRDLFKCVCPVGYNPVKKDQHKNSTQCALLSDEICENPLLNKCQHLCKVDRHTMNTYRCYCLPGYRPGLRPGLDDHMCFFDEHLDQMDSSSSSSSSSSNSASGGGDYYRSGRSSVADNAAAGRRYTFRAHLPESLDSRRQAAIGRPNKGKNIFSYDNATEGSPPAHSAGGRDSPDPDDRPMLPLVEPPANRRSQRLRDYIIRREPIVEGDKGGLARKTKPPQVEVGQVMGNVQEDTNDDGRHDDDDDDDDEDDDSHSPEHHLVNGRGEKMKMKNGVRDYYLEETDEYNLGLLSAQDRCSMFCEDNKICVLEEGTRDSYRCVCDRQGYVSVGDRCLDWCSAAEFSHVVQYWLEQTCLSGVCVPIDSKPSVAFKHQHQHQHQQTWQRKDKHLKASEVATGGGDDDDDQLTRLLRESSWRPTFECDCSTSPLLFKDPDTRLCKLDFNEIIRPCLPGNEGYVDCVQNKNAYCAVLHRPTGVFFRDLQGDQPPAPIDQTSKPDASGGAGPTIGPSMSMSAASKQQSQQENEKAKKARAKERAYTCVCSPEKKFLVDKPRNKARCIDECNLLNTECGRFNRMCRAATIDPMELDRYGTNWNLLRYEPHGGIRQFKRTGCECLPGFNVGPSEYVDFFPKDDTDNPIFTNSQQPQHQQQQQQTMTTINNNYNHQESSSFLGSTAAGGSQPAASFVGLPSGGGGGGGGELANEFGGGVFAGSGGLLNPNGAALRTKYMNINSRCLLDYDVVEFHASFKAPADFEPGWIEIRNTKPLESGAPSRHPPQSTSTSTSTFTSTSTPSQSQSNSTSTPGASEASPEADKAPRILKPDSYTTDQEQQQQQEQAKNSNSADFCRNSAECLLKVPEFMRSRIDEFHKSVVFVGQCDLALARLSLEAYRDCIRYRYWMLQKLRKHFADWRQVMGRHLKETFDLMDGNIRLRVNKCAASIRRLSTVPRAFAESMESLQPPPQPLPPPPPPQQQQQHPVADKNELDKQPPTYQSSTSKPTTTSSSYPATAGAATKSILSGKQMTDAETNQTAAGGGGPWREPSPFSHLSADELPGALFDPLDQYALIDADVHCELTIHSASDDTSMRHARKVLLEKQLPRFIFNKPQIGGPALHHQQQQQQAAYYLMAPNALIQRESFDQLAKHRKAFSPCKSDYAYCDNQTRCEMVDTVNFTCTCEYGYTPIGSRDIYQGDSRLEVCEDIDECLFDVCKENGLENKSICINEIGDYKCRCIAHHIGDNKRYCNHICNVIACKFGDCRIPDEHHAYCECFEGYREADCSVLDPSVALRKANMIICGSIFTSVLLLAITLAISLNSQLKKTKKKLKRLQAANEAAQMFELPGAHQQPFRSRMSKVSVCS